ncbi:unnamed protein product [Prorocentrum cordatum]|uniref:Uncharacterized protein n=1 Tax=Prorocentrum cordatum TaxID=2364126 RepID=A0ABN9PK23_9DINO|nr:unnamed protein product [Polarella glacialis]
MHACIHWVSVLILWSSRPVGECGRRNSENLRSSRPVGKWEERERKRHKKKKKHVDARVRAPGYKRTTRALLLTGPVGTGRPRANGPQAPSTRGGRRGGTPDDQLRAAPRQAAAGQRTAARRAADAEGSRHPLAVPPAGGRGSEQLRGEPRTRAPPDGAAGSQKRRPAASSPGATRAEGTREEEEEKEEEEEEEAKEAQAHKTKRERMERGREGGRRWAFSRHRRIAE